MTPTVRQIDHPASDGGDDVVVVECPYCGAGPRPATYGPNVCSKCGNWFEVEHDDEE